MSCSAVNYSGVNIQNHRLKLMLFKPVYNRWAKTTPETLFVNNSTYIKRWRRIFLRIVLLLKSGWLKNAKESIFVLLAYWA